MHKLKSEEHIERGDGSLRANEREIVVPASKVCLWQFCYGFHFLEKLKLI